MASRGQHQHLFKEMRFKMPCLTCMLWKLVLVILTCLSCNTVSFPITDKETGQELNAYMYMGNGTSRSGRTLMQTNDFFDECEFGNSLQNYDETCPGGATGLIPCNPGQLKVDECIGQNGDTSRMCDPCPQKFYQSFYNKCTRCHQCSECGPNEEISDPCTDETDTVCRSIIPPDPVTATSPAPDTTTKSQPQTQTTATTTASTTQQSVVSTVSPSVVTYGNVDSTTEILRPETTTGGIEEPIPPVTSYKDTCVDGIVLAVIASIFILVLLIIVVILFYICWKQRREINRLQKMLASSESSQRPLYLMSSPSDEPDRDLEPDSSQDHHESSSTAQRTVVDCPEDEKPSVFSRVLSTFDVVKDSIHVKGPKRKKKRKEPRVNFHKGPSGSGPSQSDNIRFTSLPSNQNTNLKENDSPNVGENLDTHEPTPPGGRRADVESGPLNGKAPGSTPAAEVAFQTHNQTTEEPARALVEPHPWNEKVPASTHTAEVHRDSQHIPEERGSGDGDSLVTGDVVPDSRPSHNGDTHHPDSGDGNDPASRSGQDGNAVPWLAEKVPGSTALTSSSTDGNESGTEVPGVDSDEHWHAEKVPGTFISNDSGATDQDMVTDAPPEEPRTLHSRRNLQAPIAGEEDYEEAVGTNTNGANAPTEDTEDDVLQRLTEPETTAGNNNEVNTTVPADADTSEDEDEDRKPLNKRFLKLFTKGKNNKKRRKERSQQMQQLITTMDIMVEELGVEYVADKIKLKTLDKLCRELGLTDTEVANYNYELKSEQNTGAELAFKMLMKVRGSQGAKFTYRNLDRALRRSNNVHVADGMVSKLRL